MVLLMNMNRAYYIILLLLIPLLVYAATTTLTSSGNWSDDTNWSGSDIGDNINDDVNWNNNLGTVTIQNGEDYTVGAVNMGNGNTLTIDAGGNLDVGDASNPDDLTTNNNTTINVYGDLEVWGDLIINNNLIFNVTGNVTVHGDMSIGNGGAVDIDGSLDVGGSIDAGNGSELTGDGTVSSGDGCSGDPDFCGGAPLPVEILFFNGDVDCSMVELNWATALEENFDFFSLERSSNGIDFTEIAQINGQGNSYNRVDYEYLDEYPIIGSSYYRLKSIDFDGYTEVFDYVVVNYESTNYHASLFPNPVADDIFNVQLNFEPTSNTSVVIYDNQGNIQVKEEMTNWFHSVDTGDLEPGHYLVKIISDKSTFVNRILIQ